ncbi:MAG TPA: DsbA family protein [Acetobacteraceae bacterium]|nr:DsbA family protein [Acetobacteraceae bacterium]
MIRCNGAAEAGVPVGQGDGMVDDAVWYFDLVSPFSHIALPAVERLAARHPVRLRPVVFGALLSHWGQVGPAELAPKRLHTYRMAVFQASRAGVPLRFPPRHPFRSLDALRLLAALDARADAVRAAFDFVWGEGRDPSAELPALAARLGLPADAAAAPAAKARLRAWTEEAAAARVFGVPTLVLRGEVFWGADAMPLAEAFLADPGLFARGEMARVADLPVGVERRPAG